MDTLFFYLSKIVWAMLSPDSFLLYLLLAGVLCLFLQKLRPAKVLLYLTAVLLLLIAFLPIGQWFLYPLETRFPANPPLPATVDGIILLGGTIQPQLSAAWMQSELTSSAEREITFAQMARQYPQARLLMTGGNGNLSDQEFREADISPTLLAALGVDTGRVVFERNSRNTYENALNSKPLILPQPDENWLLITSAYHMPRSAGIFCRQGWRVLPWPVDHQTSKATLMRIGLNLGVNLNTLRVALHEWAGLLAYYMTDKTTEVLPGICPLEK